jgi:DNA-binding NtrC family response regulator
LSNAVERAIIIHEGKPLSFEDIVGIQAGKSENTFSIPENKYLTLKNIEALHISRAMETAGGKVEGKNGAAAILGMNPGTLRSKMRKLGIPFGKATKI